MPRSPGPPPQGVRDICFTLVESRDLKYFSGTWRIESRDGQARLIYAVEVLPQPWLPVCACMHGAACVPCTRRALLTAARPPPRAALIANRVGKDLRGNLAAVRDHSEELGQSAVAVPRSLGGAPAPRMLRAAS